MRDDYSELISELVRAMASGNYLEASRIAEEFKANFGPMDPMDVVGIVERVNNLRKQWANEENEFNSHLGRF